MLQYLFTNYYFNGTTIIHSPTTIVVSNGIIKDIVNYKIEQATVIQGLLCPAFINTHCHLELSHLHNKFTPKQGLIHFLQQVNEQRNATPDIILQKIHLADAAMHQNGIIAVGDISNTTHTINTKIKSKIYYHTFVECFGVLEAGVVDRFNNSTEVSTAFTKANLPNTLVPHASYSVHSNLYKLLNQTKPSINTIHNQECAAEDELIKNGTGAFVPFLQTITNNNYTPLPHNINSLIYNATNMYNAANTLWVHNTFTTQADVLAIQNLIPNRHWVLCPKANLYIEDRLPAIAPYLLANKENICIGTDSLASNNSLSIIEELAVLQQVYNWPLATLLQIATSNGAKALGLSQLGNIAIGQQASLLSLQITDEANLHKGVRIDWV
jgi:aminodeoxyfutalosine deaminase